MAEASRKITYYWPVFLLVVVFSVSVFDTRDPYFVTGFLLAAQIGLSKRRDLSLTLLDCAVFSLWVYELILLFTTVNIHIIPLRTLTITTLYYWLLRSAGNRERRLRAYLFACSLMLGLMALIAWVSFHLFAGRLAEGGIEELYHFRFLHNSLGYLGNVWGNLLIGFLGLIALAAYRNRHSTVKCTILVLATIPVVWDIIRSFSRGVYLAFGLMLAVFFTALLASRLTWRRKLIGCTVVLGALVFMGMPYPNEIMRTIRMTETISQQRSIDSRIDGAQASWEIGRQYPLTGVGSGNYTLAANKYLFENDYTPFTSIPPGTFLQLSVEKGLIGTLLWLAIPGLLVWMLFRDRHRNIGTAIIFTTLGAVALREMTFPALLDYKGMQLVVFTLIAAYQNQYRALTPGPVWVIPAKIVGWIKWVPSVVCVGILAVGLERQADERANIACLEAVAAGDLAAAEAHIRRAGSRSPYRINLSAVHWRMFLSTGDSAYLARAEEGLRRAAHRNPMDVQLEYDRAVVLETSGKRDSALHILHLLTERFPDNALYRLTLFEMTRNNGYTDPGAAENLARAITLNPGILETPLWADPEEQDSSLRAQVISILRAQAEKLSMCISSPQPHLSGSGNRLSTQKEYNPIELAHYGKIMFIFGYKELSWFLLSQAVEALPNLSRPWCYLGALAWERGDTAQGRRYWRQALALDPSDTLPYHYMAQYTGNTIPRPAPAGAGTGDNPYRFLYRNARLKFSTWYNAMPLTFDYLGPDKPSTRNR